MLPQPGERFARRYRIVRVIGRGAMGVVHEAVHEPLDQRVAIKILRAPLVDANDERAAHRFEREAKLASRLVSPGIVKILDVDRTEAGVPYIVMELLEGRDLAFEVEARGEIPFREAVGWMLRICDAMQEAHAAGIVHRDLKLSNVFLTRDGDVKVLDFGVAALRASDSDASTTTNVAGTPLYMSPEQLLGEAPHPASDVWAVGVMLYRILSGRFPYDAPTPAAQMLAIMEGCAPLEQVAPHVPEALARVVRHALGRTLEERCPSMDALRISLAPLGPPNEHLTATEARPSSSSPPRATSSPGRTPSVGARARTALVVLVVLGLVSLLVTGLARQRREVAQVQAPTQVQDSPSPRRSATLALPTTSAASAESAPAPSAPSLAPRGSSPPSAMSVVHRRAPAPSAPPTRSAPAESSTPGGGFPTHL